MNRRGNSLLIAAFICMAVCLALLWAMYAVASQHIPRVDYSAQDSTCIAEGRGRAVIADGKPAGCTSDPTAYRGSLH